MTKVVLRVELDEATVQKYGGQAKQRNQTIEDLLADRLIRCVKYDSEKPLYINDEQRQAIEKALGINLNTTHKLVASVERLSKVDVSGSRISLPLPVLERIKTRCFRRPYEEVLEEQVLHSLEQFAGLR